MTRDENLDLNSLPRPVERNPDADRHWVLGSLVALVAIFGFFLLLSRYEGTTQTASNTSSPPASMPSAGSSSLPAGPGTSGSGSPPSAPANR